MALYGYSYGLGFGLVTTSFYSAVYGMRSIRQSDDAVNYAISGFMNGAILVSYPADSRNLLIVGISLSRIKSLANKLAF